MNCGHQICRDATRAFCEVVCGYQGRKLVYVYITIDGLLKSDKAGSAGPNLHS